MFGRAKIIIVISLAFVFAAGLTVNAQMTNNRAKGQSNPRFNQQARTNMPQMAGPNGARRPGARLMSVEGLLLPPMKDRIAQMASRIGLDDKQQTRLTALSNRFYKAMKDVLLERAKSMQEIRKMMMSRKLNVSSLRSAAEKVRSADEQILDAEIIFWADFKSVLTPQQQTEYNKMNQSMGGNQRQGMNMNPNGMGMGLPGAR